jgi:hypothetical protein
LSETLESMLVIYLADLRTHVDAQLRRLTDLQRLSEALPRATPRDRARDLSAVVRDLQEFDAANVALHESTATALETARTLQGARREE